MKSIGRSLACTVALVAITGTCFAFIPTRASATEYSGTSPSFATGQTWSLDVGWANAGDIITWDWGSSDSLIFSFCKLPNTYYSGLTNYDGIVVDTAGEYVMRWYNNNLIFSATVDYWVASFTPSFSVSSPSEGAYVNSKTISVQGTTDAYTTGVLVGPDALHLKEADWSGNDWGVDGLVLNEGQNSILVRSYYILDYYGYKNITYDKTVHVVADTVSPELVITHPVNDTYDKGDLDVTWQCSDLNGVVKSEVKLDAWGWETVSGTTYHTSLADGNHSVQVRVTDPAGNQAVQSVSFIADSTPPELTIFGPIEGSVISEKRVVFGGTDNIGVAEYWTNVDSQGWHPALAGTVLDLDLTDGVHTVQVKLIDRALNEVVRTVNFTLDTTDPLLQISGPVDGSTIRGNDVTVTWKYSDNIGIKDMRMKIDGLGGGTVEDGQLADLKLANGQHTIDITVTDLAGNQVTKRVTFTMNSQALSFGGPYYGIPLVAIIAGVILVGLFVALTILKRRRAPAAPPPQPPAAPPSAP